ncbi:zinc finger protein ZAT1-like isoform X1 [Zingiber officinale]|nr:zinc finger protein ZAT1-like isoform X1 [Zingiber officinale]XP_042442959.1 zinc finger protein ZAT1-like isoform X1 [Zingiber officinale]
MLIRSASPSSCLVALQLQSAVDSSWSFGVGKSIKIRSLRLGMEGHRCGLCFRRFSSGRALGGHMRSHVVQRRLRIASPFASSRAFPEAATWENRTRRRSFRGGSSHVEESEEEEEEEESFQRRLDRPRRKEDLSGETEPRSSVSDSVREEDVAFCLMLLSRDAWSKTVTKRCQSVDEEEIHYGSEEKEYQNDGELPPLAASKSCPKRTKYQCDTCRKSFKSYQALGGHRAIHKRKGTECATTTAGVGIHVGDPKPATTAQLYHCPYCPRTFISGQALGGHKRSHLAASTTSLGGFIDINHPAPSEEETELSAVSVASELASKCSELSQRRHF